MNEKPLFNTLEITDLDHIQREISRGLFQTLCIQHSFKSRDGNLVHFTNQTFNQQNSLNMYPRMTRDRNIKISFDICNYSLVNVILLIDLRF